MVVTTTTANKIFTNRVRPWRILFPGHRIVQTPVLAGGETV